jgi:hypothetical protein
MIAGGGDTTVSEPREMHGVHEPPLVCRRREYPARNPFCEWGWISPAMAGKGSAGIMQ